MNSAAAVDRDLLVSLLGAFEQPDRAAALHPEPRLVAVARHHRLSPILSAVCAQTLPPALMDAFRRDRVIATAGAMILSRTAEECVAAFAARGIPTIVLKGLDYEHRLYGGPGLRPTGDVDLLVPNEHRRDAFELMDQLGFEPRAAAPGFDDVDYHEVAWQRGNVEVDLHLGLAPTARCRIDYQAVWADRKPFRVGGTEASVLSPSHAALFQALHMTIDHFGVPAIYLIDLAKLLPSPDALDDVRRTAAAWRCRRPLATAVAMTAAFLPEWKGGRAQPRPAMASRIIARFGSTEPLSRPEQLLRKIMHFDDSRLAAHYFSVQAMRNVREHFEKNIRRRTARERLRLLPRVNSSQPGRG